MKIKDTLIFRDKLSWKSHFEAWIFWLKLHTVFAQHEHQRRGCHGNPWRPRLGEGQTKCDLWNWHKPQFHVSRHLDLSVLASNLHELSSHGFSPPQFHLQTSLSPLRADFQYPCPENCKINSHQVKWCFFERLYESVMRTLGFIESAVFPSLLQRVFSLHSRRWKSCSFTPNKNLLIPSETQPSFKLQRLHMHSWCR